MSLLKRFESPGDGDFIGGMIHWADETTLRTLCGKKMDDRWTRNDSETFECSRCKRSYENALRKQTT